MEVCVGLAVLGLAFLLYKHWKSEAQDGLILKGYEGPPLLGFLVHFIWSKNYMQKLVQVAKKYGPLCTVQMGSFRTVWINDHALLREAWSRWAFSGRPEVPGVVERTHGLKAGIIFNDGEAWKEHHKFVVKTLRDLGFGTKSMEQLMQSEALKLVELLRSFGGKPVSTEHMFNMSVVNALWTLVTGARMEEEDGRLQKLVHVLDKNMELNEGGKAAFFMPWLARLFPNLSGWNKYIGEAREVFDFWKEVAWEQVKGHEEGQDRSPVGGPESFVSRYIERIQAEICPESPFHEKVGMDNLAATLQDLFIAGTETTATTLRWALLYLAAFPEVQAKCVEEVKSHLGVGEEGVAPSVEDRKRLQYVEATIMETMRLGTLAPLGMFHRTVEDAQIQSHMLPKDTIVISNVAGIHLDADIWGADVDEFRPERFLVGGKVQWPKYLLPFGHGKRKCIGEPMARDQLFLFVTVIIQNFEVKLAGDGEVSLDAKVGVSAIPMAHKLVFKKRDSV